jgi:Mn-dependent DtxR family transcriptional regulator
MKITIDERFLIKAYEKTILLGDISSEIDTKEIASSLSIRDKKLKTILQNLARCFFIKRVDDNIIEMTSKGIKLAESLRSSV